MTILWAFLVSLGILIWAVALVRRGRRLVQEADDRTNIMTAVVEQGPAVVGITDLNGHIQYINPAFERTSGYTMEEAQGKSPRILQSGVTPGEIYAELWETITNGGVWSGELCNKRKDGNLYWEHASISAIQNRKGETTHYVKVAEEITAQKRTNAALASSEKRFRSVFEQASVGMALVDRQGRWLDLNERLSEIVGYTAEELVGKSFLGITPEEDRAKEADWNLPFENGELTTGHLEKRYLHKDGSKIWADVSTTLVRDEVGAPQYYIFIIKDTTRLRQAEQEAVKRQNELAHLARVHTLQQMTSELAHEIDQPLCAILSASQASLRLIEKDECKPSPDLLDALKMVAGQAERAGRVVDGIRKFSRVHVPENQALDLNQIIQDACELMAAELRSQIIELQLNLDDPTDLPINCNSVQIEQVIVNLCRNGVDAMIEDGSPVKNLTITSTRDNGMAKVAISNTGPAIKAELADKIFSPFFTTRINGLGLGLSLSRSIIETHAGQLWVEPGNKEGTTFQFTIPLQD
ncbi:MAG: PAS domain S-box protein [Gemmatimonadales bacterium]|nr:PAS domain S-box protein [Gemmatimonadales bacterium]